MQTQNSSARCDMIDGARVITYMILICLKQLRHKILIDYDIGPIHFVECGDTNYQYNGKNNASALNQLD